MFRFLVFTLLWLYICVCVFRCNCRIRRFDTYLKFFSRIKTERIYAYGLLVFFFKSLPRRYYIPIDNKDHFHIYSKIEWDWFIYSNITNAGWLSFPTFLTNCEGKHYFAHNCCNNGIFCLFKMVVRMEVFYLLGNQQTYQIYWIRWTFDSVRTPLKTHHRIERTWKQIYRWRERENARERISKLLFHKFIIKSGQKLLYVFELQIKNFRY